MADKYEKTGNPYIDARQERIATSGGRDRRRLRWALGIAIAVHLVFLALKLPNMLEAQTPPKPEQEKPYVIHQVKFRPPPPPEEKPKPKPKKAEKKPAPKPEAKKLPVPDETPDEPEPVVEPEPPPQPDEVIEYADEPEITPEPQPDLPAPDLAMQIPGPPPPAEPTGPIRVGGDVKAPVKVNAPDPKYPDPARAAKVEGVVVIEAIIDRKGNVTHTKIVKDLPMGLGDAAQRAIKGWKFKPATLNGKPVEVYYNLTVNFTLD